MKNLTELLNQQKKLAQIAFLLSAIHGYSKLDRANLAQVGLSRVKEDLSYE